MVLMASWYRQHEVILPRSPKPIQGIPFQGAFDLDALLVECFHYDKARTHFYTSLHDCLIEVEHPVNLCAFQDTPFPTIIHERG